MRSFLYRLDLRDLDIIYITIYPAFIRRVPFKPSALGEYLY